MDILNGLSTMPYPTLAALAAVVLIGLPHGALDGAIALHLGFFKSTRSFARFITVYVAAAFGVVGAWLIAPVLCLCTFLMVSLYHFGSGDARTGTGWRRGAEIVAHGGLVIAGISQFHRAEVDTIFGYLAGGQTAMVWHLIDAMSIIVVLACLFCVAKGILNAAWRGNAAELTLLGFTFAFMPPLVGFALYFCFVHSARHLRTIVDILGATASKPAILIQALVFTLASWGAGAAAFWSLSGVGSVDAALLRVVFIGLAALTLPHIVLVDGLFRPGKRQDDEQIHPAPIPLRRGRDEALLPEPAFRREMMVNEFRK